MNRNLYALLIFAIIAALLNVARAETMSERKQRIMRKYMRERQDIVQSDLGVPDAPQEDERVIDSEQFKAIAPDFQRQKDGLVPPSVVGPLPVQQPERNWWLETAEMENDPFADPFSSKTDTEKGSADSWSPWGKRDDSSAYGGAYGQQRDAREGLYLSNRDGSSIYGDGVYGRQQDGRSDTYTGSQSVFGMPGEFGNGSSLSGVTYDDYTTRRSSTSRERDRWSGFYGGQQNGTRGMDAGWGYNSVGGYGSSPSSVLLPSPMTSTFDTQRSGAQNQIPAYTPYRNPYHVQGEQRGYGDNYRQPQQPQYSRPTNYQNWKNTNKAWDPTSGNAYLDELMRDQRQ